MPKMPRATKSPLFWAVCYLIAIPVFALSYYIISPDFHQSTLMAEPNTLKLKHALMAEFREILSEEASSLLDYHPIDSISIYVLDLTIRDNRALFDTEIRLETDDGELSTFRCLLGIETPMEVEALELADEMDDGLVVLGLDTSGLPACPIDVIETGEVWVPCNDGPPNTDQCRITAHNLFACYGWTKSGPILAMRRSVMFLIRLRHYAIGSAGLSLRVTDSFVRMFYLSCVTITTLGYGDIVPLTTRARLMVSAEAVIGVVIAGLFLITLADRIPKRVYQARNDSFRQKMSKRNH
jgi:voltage-gated potassium channel Kch